MRQRCSAVMRAPVLACLGLLAGCPARVPSDDAVVGLCVQTSFLDTGLRAIVFEDETGFAYKRPDSGDGETEFFSFRLAPQQMDRVVLVFYRNKFFRMPRVMSSNVNDGTSVWLMIANSSEDHRVYNYMVTDDGFCAVRKEFEEAVAGHLRKENVVPATQLLRHVADRMRRFPADSPKRETVSLWLDLAARDAQAKDLVEPDRARPFQIAGDGAALYRELRVP